MKLFRDPLSLRERARVRVGLSLDEKQISCML